MWDSDPNGLPKEDETRGLFQRASFSEDKHGQIKWRKVLKNDRMWFHLPELPGVLAGAVPAVDFFFHSQVFFLETSRCVALQPLLSKTQVPGARTADFSRNSWNKEFNKVFEYNILALL